jgi:hypothetical protein
MKLSPMVLIVHPLNLRTSLAPWAKWSPRIFSIAASRMATAIAVELTMSVKTRAKVTRLPPAQSFKRLLNFSRNARLSRCYVETCRGPLGLLCRESSRHLWTGLKTSPRQATLQAGGRRHVVRRGDRAVARGPAVRRTKELVEKKAGPLPYGRGSQRWCEPRASASGLLEFLTSSSLAIHIQERGVGFVP